MPLRVRISLSPIPTGCEGPLIVGLQRGRDGLVAGVLTGDGVVLEGAIEVKHLEDGGLDFAGPLVHGRKGERFLYVSWGTLRAGRHAMFRRLKVHLGPLRRAAWEQPGLSLEDVASGAVVVSLDGRAKDGGPACGSAAAMWRPG